MAGQDRAETDLVELLSELEQAPHEFDFFQALRRLESLTADRPRLGESARATEDPIRLGQEPSLAFAPRTLSGLVADPSGAPPRVEVLFFGLFGPNGPLPLHLSEYARNRLRQEKDPAFARFCDIFHHRFLSLFYRAWAMAQPTVSFDRPETDRFADYVGSLIGLGHRTLRDRDSVPDHAKFHYAGRLASESRHPEGLQAMLEDFFGLPVAIEEFVGRWTEIPEPWRCVLDDSATSSALGVATTIGAWAWDCQQTFRVVVGPIGLEDYRRLLPGGNSLTMLIDLVRNYLGDELMWELRLILCKKEVPPVRLGQSGHLGLTAWLDPKDQLQDADDLSLNPQSEGDLLEEPWLAADLASLRESPSPTQPTTK